MTSITTILHSSHISLLFLMMRSNFQWTSIFISEFSIATRDTEEMLLFGWGPVVGLCKTDEKVLGSEREVECLSR